MTKISVIIPFYKVESYITQCLDSVVRQTLSEIEILCIDDKSPDKSINIVRKYARQDSRIRIFQHDKNQGLGAARNTGIKNAEGEYLFFLDSDDWLLDDGLQRLYDAAKKYDIKVVSAPFKRYVESTNTYKKTRIKEKGKFLVTNKKFFSLDYNAFKLYHKSILDDSDIRFPDRLIHEDVEFYWKVFTMHHTIYCLKDPVMVYRIRTGSIMTAKKRSDYCNNNIQLLKNIFLFLEKKKITTVYREAFTKEYYHFYFMGTTFDTEKFRMELEPILNEHHFKIGFSMRKIRKWFFHKKFDKNERVLRLCGVFLIRKKL